DERPQPRHDVLREHDGSVKALRQADFSLVTDSSRGGDRKRHAGGIDMRTNDARRLRPLIGALILGVASLGAAAWSSEDAAIPSAARALTIGVVGDMPYSTQQFAAFQGFLNAMSADRSFQLVVHLGDIKSGSTACTDAYIKGIRDALNSYA